MAAMQYFDYNSSVGNNVIFRLSFPEPADGALKEIEENVLKKRETKDEMIMEYIYFYLKITVVSVR